MMRVQLTQRLPSLLDEIWFRILTHVPAEYLQGLKLVCTSRWKAITDKKFEASHLEKSRRSIPPRHGILVKMVSSNNWFRSWAAKYPSVFGTHRISYLNFELKYGKVDEIKGHRHGLVRHLISRHGMQPYCRYLEIKVIDYCDGIILAAIFGYYFSKFKDAILLLIFNPVTRCYKLLSYRGPPWRLSITGWRIVHCFSAG
ncbi:hypothetical protein CDL15_Pgr012109 [Punica granatum]|nr:hypothetical protein CDL15_Pgr012109 [Punica granatum]